MKNSQQLLFVFLGIVFWFVAAMIVRFCGATVFSEGNPNLFYFFLLTIPITMVFLYITVKISTLPYNALLKPIVIITVTATFLDAVAMTWFRALYSTSFEVAFYGAAMILWGVGLGLLFAYVLEKSNKNPKPLLQISTTFAAETVIKI